MHKKGEIYIRNIVFGMSDSLVSTLGLLSGIDVAGASHQNIVATGIIYALVAGFSMAVGSFLSEQSAAEFKAKAEVGEGKAIMGAVIIFVSFVVASFIPLVPYLIADTNLELGFSIAFSIVTLFAVGIVSAHISKVSILKRAFTMVLLGGAAILIGVFAGKLIKTS